MVLKGDVVDRKYSRGGRVEMENGGAVESYQS